MENCPKFFRWVSFSCEECYRNEKIMQRLGDNLAVSLDSPSWGHFCLHFGYFNVFSRLGQTFPGLK